MANSEHLQILRQGVEVWNQWREQHRALRSDLGFFASDAVIYSSLTPPDLADADLTRATLTKAFLPIAYFYRADLTRANLSEAYFYRADFTGATLTRATLAKAKLTDATLTRADLSWVRLYDTVFANTNLTDVLGLETCQYDGPSTLDHRTLAKSGPLPLAFLRGCGLPDALINYLPLHP